MSEVISFRLNENNPREARALHILRMWNNNGYSVRYTIIEALLRLNENTDDMKESLSIEGLSQTLIQVNQLLLKIDIDKTLRFTDQEMRRNPPPLTENFKNAVVSAAKSGLKPEM